MTKANQDWRNGAARHLLRLFQEGLNLMDCYLAEERNIEMIIDRQPISQHIYGPVNYDYVLQTYQNIDEYLKQLGAFVVHGNIPGKDFDRLVYQRNILVKLCENKRKAELGVAA
ncbi:MAG: hypothetical protein AABX54_04350 [Nanoarchaeota archaeon]